MTSIGIGTLILIMILLPGFLFMTEFAGSSRLLREDLQKSTLVESAILITVAIVLHLLCGSFLILVTHVFGDHHVPRCLAEHLLQYPAGVMKCKSGPQGIATMIIIYVVFTSIFSALLGRYTIALIEAGPFTISGKRVEIRRYHGAYYDLCRSLPGFEPLVTATVVTKLGGDETIIVYWGYVAEIRFGPQRRVNVLSLVDVRSTCIQLAEKFEIPGQETDKWIKLHGVGGNVAKMSIAAEEISDISFGRQFTLTPPLPFLKWLLIPFFTDRVLKSLPANFGLEHKDADPEQAGGAGAVL